MAAYSRQETLVLATVRSLGSLSMEEAVAKLPELSWGEFFQAVDMLSRRGAIVLQRRGFDFFLSSLSTHSEVPVPANQASH